MIDFNHQACTNNNHHYKSFVLRAQAKHTALLLVYGKFSAVFDPQVDNYNIMHRSSYQNRDRVNDLKEEPHCVSLARRRHISAASRRRWFYLQQALLVSYSRNPQPNTRKDTCYTDW
jgi:hypothetical protein